MLDMFNGKADAKQISKWYKLAKDESQDFRKRAKRSYKMYFGQQWETETYNALERAGKPALVINKIKPIIRTLSGYMRQNRKDLRVAPRRGGVHVVAQTYTELLKYVYDYSLADWVNPLVFTDGIIGGKGWVSIDRDFTNDPITGDMVITREDPFLIFEDPYSQRYDLADARFIFRGRWMDIAQINTMFPQTKELMNDLTTEGVDSYEVEVEDDYESDSTNDLAKLSNNRYFVKECWYKSYEQTKFISVNGTESIDISHVGDEELKGIIMQNPQSKVVTRVMPRLRLAITLGNIILHEDDDPFSGSVKFPLVRFCNEYINAGTTYIRGEVEDIIGAQEEHNKRRSQSLHLLNSSANSGWIVEETAMSPTEIRKLESEGSRSGYVGVVRDGGLARIQKISPVALSDGHVTLSNFADADMKAISGVNSDLLGNDKTASSSGVAMEMRRRQGMISVESSFDNHDYTQRILGDTMLDYLRKTEIYTPEEIAAIVGGKVKRIDGQVVSEEEIVAYMKTRKGLYSVAMSDAPNNPTVRQANFNQMVSAVKELGIPVPPEMIVENSDFAFKDELLEKMKQAQAQQQIQGQPVVGSPAEAQSAMDMGQITPEQEAEFQARYAQEQGMV